MKVKFLDVIQMGTHLYKSGEVGEFSSQTAEELIKKGLAVLDDGTETAGTTPDQKPKTGKGGKGSKGKNAEPPKMKTVLMVKKTKVRVLRPMIQLMKPMVQKMKINLMKTPKHQAKTQNQNN
ncbi:hypothetical protein MKR65_17195 [Acinetobacter baumannii]